MKFELPHLFKGVDSASGSSSESEAVRVEENELPESVREEIAKIKSDRRYMSADADGILRIGGYKKTELSDDGIMYVAEGSLSRQAGKLGYIGDQPVEIVIITKDGSVTKTDFKMVGDFRGVE